MKVGICIWIKKLQKYKEIIEDTSQGKNGNILLKEQDKLGINILIKKKSCKDIIKN